MDEATLNHLRRIITQLEKYESIFNTTHKQVLDEAEHEPNKYTKETKAMIAIHEQGKARGIRYAIEELLAEFPELQH